MAFEYQKSVWVNLRLSPALHRQLELAAQRARRPLEGTIKCLLWIGLGSLNLKAKRLLRDRDC